MSTKTSSKKASTKAVKKTTAKKSTEKSKSGVNDTDAVNAYMEKLKHPLKTEIETVRTIIKSSDKSINERVKWNAPSFFTHVDLVTFNHRNESRVHLVFHHPAIVNIKSDLLEGDYKDRRMAYFADMKNVNAKKKELVRVMKELVKLSA